MKWDVVLFLLSYNVRKKIEKGQGAAATLIEQNFIILFILLIYLNEFILKMRFEPKKLVKTPHDGLRLQ